MKVLSKAMRAAGLAIWHFLVGDVPEFLPAVLVVVGFALAVHRVHLAVVLGLPLLVVTVLTLSVRRGRFTPRRKS